MEIREPTPADAEAVGRMHWTAWREAYTPLIGAAYFAPEREAQRIDSWRGRLAAPDGTVRVRIAVADGEVVGHAVAGPAQQDHPGAAPVREQELLSLYVLAARYGDGLGARLLDAVLPPGPAQLWVFEANARARAFYAKQGFVPDGARHVLGPDLATSRKSVSSADRRPARSEFWCC